MTSKLLTKCGALVEYLRILKPFFDENDNTEIVINKPGEVITESVHGWQHHDLPKLTYEACYDIAKLTATFSGQSLSERKPIISATLPEGERIQIVIPPATRSGHVSLTIRKPSIHNFTLQDYERQGAFEQCVSFTDDLAAHEKELLKLKKMQRFREFLELAVKSRLNIIVSGSTGSGKTTLMRSLLQLVPEDERLISIENVDELKLYLSHKNSVPLFYSANGQGISNLTQQHLLESCLRMKPDRIFVAELIRGDEAFYYLRNVNSGHPGSITSMHANSARLAMEQLVLFLKESQSGGSMTRQDIKQILFMCVDVIIQIKNIQGKRLITEIYYDPEFKRQQMA